jgi:hypothetical protein
MDENVSAGHIVAAWTNAASRVMECICIILFRPAFALSRPVR